jgi:hypothetical protein
VLHELRQVCDAHERVRLVEQPAIAIDSAIEC